MKAINSVFKKLTTLEGINKNIILLRTVVKVLTKYQENQKKKELPKRFWESFGQDVTLSLTLKDDLELEAEKTKSGIFITQRNPNLKV